MDPWDMTGPDLPSLKTLSRVSQFHDLSHCSHELGTDFSPFLGKSNSKKFWSRRVRFQVRYQKIASSIQRKRFVVALDYSLLAYCDLPLPPNLPNN